jgi:hypothetical protein
MTVGNPNANTMQQPINYGSIQVGNPQFSQPRNPQSSQPGWSYNRNNPNGNTQRASDGKNETFGKVLAGLGMFGMVAGAIGGLGKKQTPCGEGTIWDEKTKKCIVKNTSGGNQSNQQQPFQQPFQQPNQQDNFQLGKSLGQAMNNDQGIAWNYNPNIQSTQIQNPTNAPSDGPSLNTDAGAASSMASSSSGGDGGSSGSGSGSARYGGNIYLPKAQTGRIVPKIVQASDNTSTDLRSRVDRKLNAERNLDAELNKDATEAKKFMMDYYNSPMFQQLYNTSVASDKKRGLTPKNLITTLNKIEYNHKNVLDNDPSIGGQAFRNIISYNPFTKETTFTPHINIKNEQLFDEFPHSAIHETSHWFDNLGRAIPQTDIDLMNKYYKSDKTGGIYSFLTDDEFKKYVAKPTETLARLRTAKYLGKKKGIYDPFKQKVNKEQYKKIKNVMGLDGFNPIDQLELIYSPEQIIDMMNKIAKNKTENSDTARYGGDIFRSESKSRKYSKFANGGDISIPQLPTKNSPLLQFYYNKI